MLTFAFSQIAFYLTLFFVLLIPGCFLLLATKMHKHFSLLELFVLASGSSIAIVNFLVILIGRSPFAITRTSVLVSIIVFCAACYEIFRRQNKNKENIWHAISKDELSWNSTILVTTLLFLTVFINAIYFKDAIFPTATDLGHHMFWAKTIATTGQLPDYKKTDIGVDYTITAPSPIADFIIGEHLFFAAIQLISGADFISAFPVLVLIFIHILTILTIFVLTRALFKNHPNRDLIAIAALFLIGPLYALTSPQAKFISGGVIGNDVGNLLIPLCMLLYFKAFSEKKSSLLAYALFLSVGMAYVHHLSTFVFIFLSMFTVLVYASLNHKTLWDDAKQWLKMSYSPAVLSVLAMAVVFVFVLYMPTYLNTKAIDTAVGAPSKASRAGLTLTQLKSTMGEARFAFAVLGILVLLFAKNIEKYRKAFLSGWLIALTVMSLRPDWLLVDIPSDRIASYIVFPTAIIGAYMLVSLLLAFKSESKKVYLHPLFLFVTFFALMIFITTSGFYDNAGALNASSSAGNALQTYAASKYLADNSTPQDIILKDHNYLSGDSWIKLFFMQGYNYPFSRGYFKRYQDTTKTREQCTNFMISNPGEAEAQKCFAGTGTDFLMVNPKMDAAQFHRLNEFWQVYTSNEVGIFYKAK